LNSQPWSFLVIRDRDGKKWLADHYKAAIESRSPGFTVREGDDSSMARQTQTRAGGHLLRLLGSD
jgi:nitroreductase